MEYECSAILWITVEANSPEEAKDKTHQKFYNMANNNNINNLVIEKTQIIETGSDYLDECE